MKYSRYIHNISNQISTINKQAQNNIDEIELDVISSIFQTKSAITYVKWIYTRIK